MILDKLMLALLAAACIVSFGCLLALLTLLRLFL